MGTELRVSWLAVLLTTTPGRSTPQPLCLPLPFGEAQQGVSTGLLWRWQVLAAADTVVFGAESNPCKSRRQVCPMFAKAAPPTCV